MADSIKNEPSSESFTPRVVVLPIPLMYAGRTYGPGEVTLSNVHVYKALRTRLERMGLVTPKASSSKKSRKTSADEAEVVISEDTPTEN